MTVDQASAELVLEWLRMKPSALAVEAADLIERLLDERGEGVVEWGVMSEHGRVTPALGRDEAVRLARRTPRSVVVRQGVHRTAWVPDEAPPLATRILAIKAAASA